MKTSIIIKETKQALANNPVKYGEYVDNLVSTLAKADRMGNLELGRIFKEARRKIQSGEWEDVNTFKEFIENCTEMSNSRATQILKGYDVYVSLIDYLHFTYNIDIQSDNIEEEDNSLISIIAKYTVTHFYELKSLEPHDIENLVSEGIITPDMSVKELKKAIAEWLNADEDNSEGEGNDSDSDDSDDSDDNDDSNEIYIRNVDDAENLYKTLLGMLNEGKTLKVNLADLA